MKYSLFINPISQKSSACLHAIEFVNALLDENVEEISVFFYGYAVEMVFFNSAEWIHLKKTNLRLTVCSTLSEVYLDQGLNIHKNFEIAGLGQWMESVLSADKRIEFA